jgi:hypothetical protein
VERPDRNPYFVDFAVTTRRYRIALEVNGSYVHRNDPDSLRFETLFLFFDDVIILTEEAIKRCADLAGYLAQLLAA